MIPQVERYTIRTPEFDFRLVRERRGHRDIYISLDDLIAWAYKGKVVNDHPDIQTVFQMIANQFERDLRE